MASDGFKAGSEALFIHVHVCLNCGQILRREEADSREVASGMFHCSKCNCDGPLNIEIRETAELDSPEMQ